jgi:hypothetical protein
VRRLVELGDSLAVRLRRAGSMLVPWPWLMWSGVVSQWLFRPRLRWRVEVRFWLLVFPLLFCWP